MTEKQAYSAMFYFLNQWYKRTNSNELGGMLGSMSLLDDGCPADPAIVSEWQEAVQFALKGGQPDPLKLS
jgi:hypothetical protein